MNPNRAPRREPVRVPRPSHPQEALRPADPDTVQDLPSNILEFATGQDPQDVRTAQSDPVAQIGLLRQSSQNEHAKQAAIAEEQRRLRSLSPEDRTTVVSLRDTMTPQEQHAMDVRTQALEEASTARMEMESDFSLEESDLETEWDRLSMAEKRAALDSLHDMQYAGDAAVADLSEYLEEVGPSLYEQEFGPAAGKPAPIVGGFSPRAERAPLDEPTRILEDPTRAIPARPAAPNFNADTVGLPNEGPTNLLTERMTAKLPTRPSERRTLKLNELPTKDFFPSNANTVEAQTPAPEPYSAYDELQRGTAVPSDIEGVVGNPGVFDEEDTKPLRPRNGAFYDAPRAAEQAGVDSARLYNQEKFAEASDRRVTVAIEDAGPQAAQMLKEEFGYDISELPASEIASHTEAFYDALIPRAPEMLGTAQEIAKALAALTMLADRAQEVGQDQFARWFEQRKPTYTYVLKQALDKNMGTGKPPVQAEGPYAQ